MIEAMVRRPRHDSRGGDHRDSPTSCMWPNRMEMRSPSNADERWTRRLTLKETFGFFRTVGVPHCFRPSTTNFDDDSRVTTTEEKA